MIHIYKIYHESDNVIAYVGSTKMDIQVRLYQHYADRNKLVCCGIAPLMREYPREQFCIDLLETCEPSVRKQREQYWIEKEGILNIQNAVKDPDYDKNYAKKYRHQNRTPEYHNQKEKEFYQKNKEKILKKLSDRKTTCECGMTVRSQHYKRHLQGTYHKYLINQTSSEPKQDFQQS